MKGWTKFSPLVEIESDSTLKQVQDGLVEGGNALLTQLAAVHPDAVAVHAAVEDIKSQLDFEDISDTWVTAHVLVGKEKRLIAKTAVRQVSMSIFFIRQLCLMCMCSICLLCSGDIAGNHRLRACVVLPLQ
jgi:hypothetical protein